MSGQITTIREVDAEPANADAAPVIDLHDRITEAYFGKMGEEFAHSCRERIHWICAKTKGKRVLDVGCSQGITAILLGREGKQVTGVEIAERSIKEARSYLAAESSRVQKHVTFLHGDILTTDLGADPYETVIMAEILEHLTHPETLVTAAAERLGENGRLVVTVPFGVNDWPDHKQTFYLLEPWQLLSSRFVIEEVRLFGKWIGFVAKKRADGAKRPGSPPKAEILAEAEAAFQSIERELLNRTAALSRQVADLKGKVGKAEERLATLQEHAAGHEAARKEAERALERLQSSLNETCAERDGVRTERNELDRETARLTAELAASKSLAERFEAKAEKSVAALEEMRAERDGVRTERNELDRETARLAAELAASQHLAKRFEAEAEKSLAALDAERVARFEAEKKQLVAERQTAEFSARLEGAENRFIQSTEELVSLKGRLDQLRAERDDRNEKVLRLANELADAEKRERNEQDRAGRLQQQLEEATREKEKIEGRLGQLAQRGTTADGVAEHIERLQRQLDQAVREKTGIHARVSLLQQQKATADEKAERARQTLSFRLGYALIFGFKSWRAFAALPRELLAIRREAVRRRAVKTGGRAPLPATHPLPQPHPSAPPAYPPAPRPVAAPAISTRSSHVPMTPADLKSLPAKKARDFKVAFIADEFTFNSFRDELHAVPLEPAGWREKFEEHKPDIFFCESAWTGPDPKHRPWRGQIYASVNFPNENRTALLDILAHCRREGIPTVFWNKEDPTHYSDRVHDFVKTAREFDFVFTSAAECVENYKREQGVRNVFALPFATNPRLFNPIETGPRSSNIVFAGSWYTNHKERSATMERMLDGFLEQGFGLELYDRYFGGDGDPVHQWPEKYRALLKPGLPHDRMPEVYKSSRFGLNFNTVTDSPTMFARRVFELMSCNTLVVSNHARGVEEMFGDLVICADREPGRLKSLSDAEIDDLRERALNCVLSEHTYSTRWRQILSAIGMPHLPADERITFASIIRSREDALAAIAWFQAHGQTFARSPLLLVIGREVPDLEAAKLCQEFNRFGVGVTSMSHAQKYALDGLYRPVETPFFALIDPRNPPAEKWLNRAVLHLQYMSEHAIAPASEISERYRIASSRPGGAIVGRDVHLSHWLHSGAEPSQIYYV